jgi:hypothetical protein
VVKRKSKIAGQFTLRLVEMQESPAYRVLRLSAHRALSRIEVELRHHGGEDNGELVVTYANFAAYGIHRNAIGPALDELEALGFIAITQKGKMAKAAEYRRPNKYRLTTYPELTGVGPEGCRWRRFRTFEAAFAAAEAARKHSEEKKRPPVRKPYRRPVRKPYHEGQIASTETVPLRMSETVPLSIYREESPPPGLARPPVAAPPPIQPDAPRLKRGQSYATPRE